MEDITKASDQELSEMKQWFFKENIRLNQAREELENEKRRIDNEKSLLNREKNLVEKKLEILCSEYKTLAQEKKKLERDRQSWDSTRKFRQQPVNQYVYIGSDVFFKGVDSEIALKKRYRDLIKIFHPDNICGDNETIQSINKEYNVLRKRFEAI